MSPVLYFCIFFFVWVLKCHEENFGVSFKHPPPPEWIQVAVAVFDWLVRCCLKSRSRILHSYREAILYAVLELGRGYFPLQVVFRKWGEKSVSLWMLHEMYIKVLSFNIYWMNINLLLCLIFEYVHKIIFLCGNLSYNFIHIVSFYS